VEAGLPARIPVSAQRGLPYMPQLNRKWTLDHYDNTPAEIARVPLKTDDIRGVSTSMALGAKLLADELSNKSANEIYHLCFSRLTKPDPLNFVKAVSDGPAPVVMRGTDQRDLFLPDLMGEGGLLRAGSRIFDVACGDGQTTQHLLRRVKSEARLTLLDANRGYLDSYKTLVDCRFGQIEIANAIESSLDEFLDVAAKDMPNPDAGAFDLTLLLHGLYFTNDLAKLLNLLVDGLAPKGRLFIIFADELDGYTGKIIERYIDRCGLGGDYIDNVRRRHAVFGVESGAVTSAAVDAALRAALARTDFRVAKAERQPSRIYGDQFSDIIAAGFITALPNLGDHDIHHKIKFVSDQLADEPSRYDLNIEMDGRRRGMISVSQPQFEVILQRQA
jgi:SAM-dependent methyltransferase